jgi:hypothetical protein
MGAPRTLAFAGLALIACTAPSPASVQGQMYCWEYDLEFPVPCDASDEEEDEAVGAAATRVAPIGRERERPRSIAVLNPLRAPRRSRRQS